MRQKYIASYNELIEKEVFLVSNGGFDTDAINHMALIDFDVYYNKKVEELLKKAERIKKSKQKQQTTWMM